MRLSCLFPFIIMTQKEYSPYIRFEIFLLEIKSEQLNI
ncbi:MAG: hypothetical protein H6Q20_2574 [Bacteroidetes bacterium]|jgi:hypothetical protein|nr:hypothetical protein [Bacteroidota bacterium]